MAAPYRKIRRIANTYPKTKKVNPSSKPFMCDMLAYPNDKAWST